MRMGRFPMNSNTKDNVMKIRTLLNTAVLLAFGGLAMAQTPAPAPANPMATPRIDNRQANQQQRIDKGVASGQLTSKEAAHMENRENKIAADETAAKADGKVTKAERAHLKKEENRASKAIHRQKHDAQKGPSAS
jgi:hypothetical protein